MFKPSPAYTRLIWDSQNGVYGYFANNNTREYVHNVSYPLLFGQDIVLKELITNLTQRV